MYKYTYLLKCHCKGIYNTIHFSGLPLLTLRGGLKNVPCSFSSCTFQQGAWYLTSTVSYGNHVHRGQCTIKAPILILVIFANFSDFRNFIKGLIEKSQKSSYIHSRNPKAKEIVIVYFIIRRIYALLF